MTSPLRKTCISLATGFLMSAAAVTANAGTVSLDGATFSSSWIGDTLRIEIDAGGPLSGGWATAVAIDSIAINDFGTFTSILLDGPGSSFDGGIDGYGLDAGGCKSLAGPAHPCFSGNESLADNMIFDFAISGGILNYTDSPHLKVRFVNSSGEKVGDLLSQDLTPVPLPGTMGLLGLGLAGLGLARRKKTA